VQRRAALRCAAACRAVPCRLQQSKPAALTPVVVVTVHRPECVAGLVKHKTLTTDNVCTGTAAAAAAVAAAAGQWQAYRKVSGRYKTQAPDRPACEQG
jgi:hypothetical protein